jgi:ATP-dependent DNA helicase RecQ
VLAPFEAQDFQGLCGEFIARHSSAKGFAPSAECLTRFLCGISVPMFTKLKARSITGFGMLENYPYALVREWVQSQV